jgi:hypothetical protein
MCQIFLNWTRARPSAVGRSFKPSPMAVKRRAPTLAKLRAAQPGCEPGFGRRRVKQTARKVLNILSVHACVVADNGARNPLRASRSCFPWRLQAIGNPLPAALGNSSADVSYQTPGGLACVARLAATVFSLAALRKISCLTPERCVAQLRPSVGAANTSFD